MKLERLNNCQNSHSSIREGDVQIQANNSKYILFHATDPNASTANAQACSFIHSATIETLRCVRQSRLFLSHPFLVGFNATLSPGLLLCTFLSSSKLVTCEGLMILQPQSTVWEVKSFRYVESLIFLL